MFSNCSTYQINKLKFLSCFVLSNEMSKFLRRANGNWDHYFSKRFYRFYQGFFLKPFERLTLLKIMSFLKSIFGPDLIFFVLITFFRKVRPANFVWRKKRNEPSSPRGTPSRNVCPSQNRKKNRWRKSEEKLKTK